MKDIKTQYDDTGMVENYENGKKLNYENFNWSREMLIKHLPSLEEKKIIDMGCGNGDNLRYFKTCGASEIIAVDPSVKMLELAKAKNNMPGVTFLEGSFDNIPAEDNSIDIVVAEFSLHYSENMDKAWQEVFRVLKNGGKFLIESPHPITNTYGNTLENGIVEIPIYKDAGDGKPVNVYYPAHTMTSYLSKEFFERFNLTVYDEFWLAKNAAAMVLGGTKKIVS